MGCDIGLREIVLGLAGVGNGDLVDDRVVAVRVEPCNQPVPLALDKLRFNT